MQDSRTQGPCIPGSTITADGIAGRVMSTIQHDDSLGTGLPPSGVKLSNRERDLMEWGAVWGISYALVRGLDPFQHLADVDVVATIVARRVWATWGNAWVTGA